jgi:hypothetical protein
VVVDANLAQAALMAHGFSKDLITPPSRRLEVSRAAYSFQNRRGKSDRRVTEKIQDNGKYASYGILEQIRVGNEEVGFRQVLTVRLNKTTGEGRVMVCPSLKKELAEVQAKLDVNPTKALVREEAELASAVVLGKKLIPEFRETLRSYTGKITDEEIRNFLRRIIRMVHGISKRPSGGIYFVPSHRADVVERAQAVLDELKSTARIYLEGVMNGERERMNVWESVEFEINARIDEAVRASDRIEKSTSAVKGHQMKLEGLDELMGVYQELLGEEAKYEEVTERIEGAVRHVQGKMNSLHAAQRLLEDAAA